MIQRLEAGGDRDAERMEANEGIPHHQALPRHAICIERWWQRRMKVLLGEPLVMDESGEYLPPKDTSFDEVRAPALSDSLTADPAQVCVVERVVVFQAAAENAVHRSVAQHKDVRQLQAGRVQIGPKQKRQPPGRDGGPDCTSPRPSGDLPGRPSC